MFQFPIRNSVRSDQHGQRLRHCRGSGFNSPFGILFVRTWQWPWLLSANRSFQFPIRNSVRSDMRVGAANTVMCTFQFPIRNSVRSDSNLSLSHILSIECFNSPFGILFVRTLLIPLRVLMSFSFNSPFGILFVRTAGYGRWGMLNDYPFQFPIRNSVRSDFITLTGTVTKDLSVSIPHSEFCSFGRLCQHPRQVQAP